MRRGRKGRNKNLYYVEIRVAGRVPLFVKPVFTRKIVDALRWSCDKRGLRIYDYSVLPDRILFLANTAWGALPEVLESYKSFTSKAVMLILRRGKSSLEFSWMFSVFQDYGPKNMPEGVHIWEDAVQIRSVYGQVEIDKCSMEIQNQAVKLGLVSKPENYLNCSANPRHPLDGWVVEAIDPWS